MKFDLLAMFEGLVGSYAKLPLSQKVALPIFVFGTMGIFYFVTSWATRPDYAVLFSDLDEADAGQVVERLKDEKVTYRLRGDGKTIDITPPSMVHEMRLRLASGGLPKSGNVGLEVLNEVGLGSTVFQQQVLYHRGIQGELERTIQSIDAVRSVRVHITLPPKSVFAKEEIHPTASVLLRLKAGMELKPDQIKGIANLVSHSVERLTPENVTILDSHGNLLNDKKGEALSQGVNLTRIDYQRGLEKGYSDRIESMLVSVLGPGRAVARVNLDLDFSQQEKEEEAFDPGSQIARSERSVEESAGAAAQGGVPGVVSNLTNEPSLLGAPNSGSGGNVRKESVKNYEVSRAVSKTISAAGKLLRASVAVLVDGQYLPAPLLADGTPDPNVKPSYQPLAPEMMKQIESLVKQAVGFDSTRGDSVTVENIRFHEVDGSLAEILAQDEKSEMFFRIGEWLIPALLIAIFFFIFVRPLVKFLSKPTESEVDLSRLLPAGIEELEAELQAERSKVQALPEGVGPTIDIEELEELLAENSRIVKDNPQQAALLIRYWINEGRV